MYLCEYLIVIKFKDFKEIFSFKTGVIPKWPNTQVIPKKKLFTAFKKDLSHSNGNVARIHKWKNFIWEIYHSHMGNMPFPYFKPAKPINGKIVQISLMGYFYWWYLTFTCMRFLKIHTWLHGIFKKPTEVLLYPIACFHIIVDFTLMEWFLRWELTLASVFPFMEPTHWMTEFHWYSHACKMYSPLMCGFHKWD